MRKSICFIVAVPGTAKSFLHDHILRLSEYYDISLVANQFDKELSSDLPLNDYKVISIQRGVSIWKDLKALFSLIKYFRDERFDVVHSVTPKAGLLTAVAGWISGIRVRIHIFTGQVWATSTGLKRWLLKTLDKVIARLDTHLLTDSNGQMRFLVDEGVVKATRIRVLGNGSICGVNLNKFCPSDSVRSQIRKELNVSDKVVFTFMGRLNHDKGITELLTAFIKLSVIVSNVFLILFGSDEENYQAKFTEYKNLNNNNFRYFGPTPTPFDHLQACDVFVLPSYREGFGSSVIEASALGLPVICSDAYGLQDAMVDGETGLRCKVADVDSLYAAMLKLYDNKEVRIRYGMAGRERVEELFSEELVGKEWASFYESIV